MKKLLLLAERAFTIVTLIHYSGGPMLVVLSDGVSEGEEGDDASFAAINGLFVIMYFITFILLLLRWKKVVPVILNNKLIWSLLAVAIASISWSAIPDLTKTRVFALTCTMMLSLYLASRYTLKEQLYLFTWTFGIIIVLCLLFGVILPKYGVMGGVHTGAWRGIYNHKNVLGKMMVFSVIFFTLVSLEAKQWRWLIWGCLTVSMGLVILSRASAPLLNILILAIVLIALHSLRWKYLLMVPSLIALASLAIISQVLLSSNAAQVVGSVGKDLSLTGRTNFWPLMLDKIWENPIFGYGFGAFWRGLDGPSAYVWNASLFKAPNGHNGYLDLWLELGLIGLSLYLIIFVVHFYKSLVYVKQSKTPEGFWPALLHCYIILANLTESSLMVQNNFLWVVQISTFLALDNALKNARTLSSEN